jgi:hypothetical protein
MEIMALIGQWGKDAEALAKLRQGRRFQSQRRLTFSCWIRWVSAYATEL